MSNDKREVAPVSPPQCKICGKFEGDLIHEKDEKGIFTAFGHRSHAFEVAPVSPPQDELRVLRAEAAEQRVGELQEALRRVIEWEKEYREINHLGQIAPHPFKQAEAALSPKEGKANDWI